MIYGDLDLKGNPATNLVLMSNAPIKPFACGVPVFGPAKTICEGVKFFNFAFDGQSPVGSTKQIIAKNATCPGSHVGAGFAEGKGFHNFIASPRAAFVDCEFRHISVKNTCGDGFRTHAWNRSSGIYLHDWYIENCGHAGLMFENTENSIIKDCKVVCRGNGALRTQNKCADIDISNVWIIGNSNDYNPGAQLAGDHLNVSGCLIHDTKGPGFDIIGERNEDINISDCTFINCGTFAKDTNYNVAAIIWNEASGSIEDCTFYGNYQNSIAANVYQPNKQSVTSKGPYTLATKNNRIINTQISPNATKYKLIGNGKHMANLLPSSHVIISEKNSFYPYAAFSQGPVIWLDQVQEDEPELIEGFDVEGI